MSYAANTLGAIEKQRVLIPSSSLDIPIGEYHTRGIGGSGQTSEIRSLPRQLVPPLIIRFEGLANNGRFQKAERFFSDVGASLGLAELRGLRPHQANPGSSVPVNAGTEIRKSECNFAISPKLTLISCENTSAGESSIYRSNARNDRRWRLCPRGYPRRSLGNHR